HVRHHTDTIVVGRDAEIIFPRPSSPASVALVFVPLVNVPKMVMRTAKHAVGRIDDEARSFIPADELPKLRWESWAYIAILSGATAWSLAAWTIVPLLYVGLPTIYGAWLMVFFAITQHAGLREDVLDHRLNTRTVYMNPVFRFLYSNMNYHVEHHIFPTVPYYSLPALHQEVKGHLAPASSNTWTAYRDILSTLRRQWRDPAYDDSRDDVPSVPDAGHAFVNTGHTVWASDRHDDMFDLGPANALAPGSARQVDVADESYALFRLDDGTLVCAEGLCTHGQAYLAEGVVLDCLVECPKHNGRFDLRTGEAVRHPATDPLTLYPVEIRNGRVVSTLKAVGDLDR
ncbi:MAG: fatty acid desaturase, partial [bacterium]|nr:fatty acid desaturase [bacterium]